MNYIDCPLQFNCDGESLLGIVSKPNSPGRTGVLLLVGGPQYRVGSHRQFVLLARALAEEGFAAMRFDYRGMGDSGGVARSFDSIDADIVAAIDAFQEACPNVSEVVLWGLCDAASASLLYWLQSQDVRIRGLCLLNPWVRSEGTLARTQVKHYYRERILQREFWVKLMRGRLNLAIAMAGLLRNMRLAVASTTDQQTSASFQERMAMALERFPGDVLLILSAEDYTAKEFLEYSRKNKVLAAALARSNVSRHDVIGADHTFSSAAWRNEVSAVVLEWLRRTTGAA